jgi:hypothetical protein
MVIFEVTSIEVIEGCPDEVLVDQERPPLEVLHDKLRIRYSQMG